MPTADELLGPAVASTLVGCLRRAGPGATFTTVADVADALDGLTLTGRVFALRDALLADVAGGFDGLETLVGRALHDDTFDGWMTWPVGEAVAVSALAVVASEPSTFGRGLALLRDLTPRLTSEFAIRPFLQHDPARAIELMRVWTSDPDPAVRRLVSEGTRPRLPWAKRVRQLFDDPHLAVPLLDLLYRDEDDTVRRSVANHVNDISRLRPELAVATCARWLAEPAPTTAQLVRHALRTLVKQAHPDALDLLGFGSADDLEVTGPLLAEATVPAEGELAFTVQVRNRAAEPVKVAIDYLVHFRKASGELAPKVFKITTRTLAPGERVTLERRRSFAPLTTRRYYPGEHAIEVQVNGRRSGRVGFELLG